MIGALLVALDVAEAGDRPPQPLGVGLDRDDVLVRLAAVEQPCHGGEFPLEFDATVAHAPILLVGHGDGHGATVSTDPADEAR